MSWEGNAELLKSLRVVGKIDPIDAHMAANVFIDNGPGGKTSDVHGLILIQPNVPIIPAIGQVHTSLTSCLKKTITQIRVPGYAY